MIRRPPRSTRVRSSAASDVYKRQGRDGGSQAAGVLLMDAPVPSGVIANGNGKAHVEASVASPGAETAQEAFRRLTERPADLLRFATAGSVDDGKSTLIGRLLYDSKQVLSDQLAHVEAASRRMGHDFVDLSLLTDGLRAEREQGIT